MSALQPFLEVLSWILILAGSGFLLIGAIGTLRFPDFWTRVHAVSVSDSGGMLLLIAGMVLHSGLTLVTAKLILIGGFIFITGPTATHAVANAALVSGLLPRKKEVPKLEDKPSKIANVIKKKDPKPRTKAKK
ncbi:MAG: monovalent cation/H(+) antiporter subunit G [Pseudomonadota bacterium]